MTIGERIKQLRTKEKISQRDLAQLLNVSQSTICTYENDTIFNYDTQLLNDMASIFNIGYEEMVDGCIISNTAKENRRVEAIEIGKRIRLLRESENLTLNKLSAKVNLSRSSLSKIETGGYDIRYRPKLKNKLCKYYSSIDDIIAEVENEFRPQIDVEIKNEVAIDNQPNGIDIVDKDNNEINEVKDVEFVSSDNTEISKDDINIFSGFEDIQAEYSVLLFNHIHTKLSYLANNPKEENINSLEKEIEWYGEFIGDNKILKYKLDIIKKYNYNNTK